MLKIKYSILSNITKIIRNNKKNYFSLIKYEGNRNMKMIKNILIFILYISGAIFYFLSLTHIEGLGMNCFSHGGIKCYYILAKLTLISGLLTGLSIYIIVLKKYNKMHFLMIIVIYIFFFLLDHHSEIVKHGFYNFIGFSIITSIFFLSLNFFHFLVYLIKKKLYLISILIIIPFPFFYFKIKIYKLNHFSCVNWNKGLNNTYIDNSSKDYPCIINIPKPNSCYLSEIGPYFDFSTKYRPTCSAKNIMEKEKEKFLKDLNKLNFSEISLKKHFGFPLTNTEEFIPDEYGNMCYAGNKSFQKEIYKKIILMDLYNKNKDKYYPNISYPEIEVIFDGEIGKIIINIEKNETLIKEREKKINRKNNSIINYKNVLILFFDTLSRAHFFRKFPKIVRFLDIFSRYETNSFKKNMSTFQYLKYNSIETFTAPNLIASYYGGKVDGNGTHFGNYFKENGFIIGRTNNFCEKEVVVNENNKTCFKHCKWDHEGLALGCIKGFYNGKFVSRFASFVKRCLFGKDLTEYSLEYLETFWNVYINQHKMFLYQTDEGHEPTGELIGHYDDIYYNFLNKFYSNGLLKDTVIIIFSDHGEHLTGPLYLFNSEDFFFERTLATLFLIIPNNKLLYIDNLFEKIKYNEQVFATPFDIYNTLIDLSNNKNNYRNYSPYGNSLFTKFDIKERFCDSPKYDNQINLLKPEIPTLLENDLINLLIL